MLNSTKDVKAMMKKYLQSKDRINKMLLNSNREGEKGEGDHLSAFFDKKK